MTTGTVTAPESTGRAAHSATTAEASRVGQVATTTNGSGHSAAPRTRSPGSATALTLATAAPVVRRLVSRCHRACATPRVRGPSGPRRRPHCDRAAHLVAQYPAEGGSRPDRQAIQLEVHRCWPSPGLTRLLDRINGHQEPASLYEAA